MDVHLPTSTASLPSIGGKREEMGPHRHIHVLNLASQSWLLTKIPNGYEMRKMNLNFPNVFFTLPVGPWMNILSHPQTSQHFQHTPNNFEQKPSQQNPDTFSVGGLSLNRKNGWGFHCSDHASKKPCDPQELWTERTKRKIFPSWSTTAPQPPCPPSYLSVNFCHDKK